MKDTILYVGNYFLPDGNAAGKRVWGNIKAIEINGLATASLSFSKGEPDNRLVDSTMVYEMNYRLGFKRMNNRLPYKAFLNVLADLSLKGFQVNVVIMYESLGNSGFNKKVIKYCKRNKISIVYDLPDWFDKPDKNHLLRYIIKKRDLRIIQKRVLPNCDAWITISSFLKNRMPDPDKTVIIPPLACKVYGAAKTQDESIKVFSYASFVTDKNRPVSEWKDRIDLIVDVFFDLLTKRGISNFKLMFIEFEKQAFLDMFLPEYVAEYENKLNTLADHIAFIGTCPNSQVAEIIRSSDFTILIRDSKVSTNAGFATKISESVSLGIPVLTNATSDVTQYIQDGVNGYILADSNNLELIEDAVEKCIHCEPGFLEKLKETTYESKTFYYKSYAEKFGEFLKGVRNK